MTSAQRLDLKVTIDRRDQMDATVSWGSHCSVSRKWTGSLGMMDGDSPSWWIAILSMMDTPRFLRGRFPVQGLQSGFYPLGGVVDDCALEEILEVKDHAITPKS